MKKHTFTLLLGWLLLMTSNLMAQNNEGRFKLKEGDWFEVEVTQDYGTSLLLPNGTQTQFIGTIYLLNYQLQKQLPNNNQQYQVSIDHFKIIRKYEKEYYGYDSYYPTFKENKTDSETVNQFSLEVTPAGKILRLTPFKTNKHRIINLTEIGSAYLSMGTATYSENTSDSLLISIFSNHFMSLDSLPSKSNTSNRKIPMQIERNDMKLVLTDASFSLPNNAMVQGRLKDQVNQNITISLFGENSDFYFPDKNFRTKNDGTFSCPIFLKRPLHLRVQVGNKTLTTFMEPGDTLNVMAIGHQIREMNDNQYVDTKPGGYFSADINKSDCFSGRAAFNTMLSNELDQYRTGFLTEMDVQSVIMKDKATKQAVNQLIESYRGKASEECISYFKSDMKYFFAFAKLYFNAHQQSYYIYSVQNKKIPYTDNKYPKIDYPTDFFLEVDTMAILMNPYEWNTSYHKFIESAQVFKQNRLGWATGKRYTGNFLESFYFSQASLQGFPLYKQIAKSIDLELRKGLSDNNIVTPYFQDFIKNCTDPSLTEPLKRVYETAEQLKIGKQFPFTSFVLPDSSIFNLEKLKGKPICIILFDGQKKKINQLKEDIEKYKSDEVEFVLVRSIGGNWIESDIDSMILNKTNVTYLEIPEKFLKSDLLLERTKIFMLDKWFHIVENNAEDPMTHTYTGRISEFEKSLRKTIDAKRYSQAEKSAFIKTAGWSLGSILFTLLVGWWIYRIRIRQIKQQEEARRRIKELEIKAIRSQMNPHFIFNALNSIQSLINGNQFKEANIYLSKFAVLLRGVLNNSEKSRVSLSDELKAVELYCQLEQLRFDFHFDITIAENVKDDLIEIPGMIIQPLAENAVVHGISGKGNQGKLNIQVSRQNGHVCIGVEDNGVGLTSQAKDTLSQKGFGLKLVEERINILNLEGKEAQLTVRDRENNSGTLATLIIPID
ncbi:MAG TPA: histidine kinase [Prolixibacteraceae bacterium]|nr:histidine kinase [Prolixibacteraceae bacterium]